MGDEPGIALLRNRPGLGELAEYPVRAEPGGRGNRRVTAPAIAIRILDYLGPSLVTGADGHASLAPSDRDFFRHRD